MAEHPTHCYWINCRKCKKVIGRLYFEETKTFESESYDLPTVNQIAEKISSKNPRIMTEIYCLDCIPGEEREVMINGQNNGKTL